MALTQYFVKELFDYNEDGYLVWRIKKAIRTKPGNRAGFFDKKIGRYRVSINGKSYLTSRIIYLWHIGILLDEIDHIDRCTNNEKIDNLRPSTRSQNCANRKSFKNSSSKYKGVYLKNNGSMNKWSAQIRKDKKTFHLGYFESEELAANAYNLKAIMLHGEFALLNNIV